MWYHIPLVEIFSCLFFDSDNTCAPGTAGPAPRLPLQCTMNMGLQVKYYLTLYFTFENLFHLHTIFPCDDLLRDNPLDSSAITLSVLHHLLRSSAVLYQLGWTNQACLSLVELFWSSVWSGTPNKLKICSQLVELQNGHSRVCADVRRCFVKMVQVSVNTQKQTKAVCKTDTAALCKTDRNRQCACWLWQTKILDYR